MHRTLQVLALLMSVSLLVFLACRAQQAPPAPAAHPPANGAEPIAAEPIDAAPAPEVYFPASKSGGAFLQHQQAPR